jgi:hypothetical protein
MDMPIIKQTRTTMGVAPPPLLYAGFEISKYKYPKREERTPTSKEPIQRINK